MFCKRHYYQKEGKKQQTEIWLELSYFCYFISSSIHKKWLYFYYYYFSLVLGKREKVHQPNLNMYSFIYLIWIGSETFMKWNKSNHIFDQTLNSCTCIYLWCLINDPHVVIWFLQIGWSGSHGVVAMEMVARNRHFDLLMKFAKMDIFSLWVLSHPGNFSGWVKASWTFPPSLYIFAHMIPKTHMMTPWWPPLRCHAALQAP